MGRRFFWVGVSLHTVIKGVDSYVSLPEKSTTFSTEVVSVSIPEKSTTLFTEVERRFYWIEVSLYTVIKVVEYFSS